MTDAGFIVPLRNRVWPTLLFLLAILVVLGFTVVLWGESQLWTDDPGAWAGLATPWYALTAAVALLAVTAGYLVLLARREVPAQRYRVIEPVPAEPATPSFLSGGTPPPADSSPAHDTASTQENPSPPAQ